MNKFEVKFLDERKNIFICKIIKFKFFNFYICEYKVYIIVVMMIKDFVYKGDYIRDFEKM